jgi:hypothetical protein
MDAPPASFTWQAAAVRAPECEPPPAPGLEGLLDAARQLLHDAQLHDVVFRARDGCSVSANRSFLAARSL